jgi:heat shock protein HslJ
MPSLHRRVSFAALFVALACAGPPPAEPRAQQNAVPTSQITQRDWVLVALSTSSTIIDTTRPPTLRLDSEARAGGFAGCNRYSASYTIRGDSLAFGPVGATKMFCSATDHLERVFLEVLARTSTYRLSDATLILRSRDGLEAHFRPAR